VRNRRNCTRENSNPTNELASPTKDVVGTRSAVENDDCVKGEEVGDCNNKTCVVEGYAWKNW
jgi:hypothetical protein